MSIVSIHTRANMVSTAIRNLQRALDLSAIVASEEASIYEKMRRIDPTTGKRPIELYLKAIKDASNESLRVGNSEFWNVGGEV
jgi:hypothetical protein